MEYKLTVIRQERNPEFTAKRSQYDREVSEYKICETALEVILTCEEFVAIKKAVIEVIK